VPLSAGAIPSAEPTGAQKTKAPLATIGEGQPEEEHPTPSESSIPLVPPPSPEGEKTVNTVLQNIVDNYVTSIVVVATEPQVPPPTQEEMPSEAVHPQHEVPESEVSDQVEPEIVEALPAAALAVLIPTAFSPNGDGVNDELVVTVQNYQKAVVRIFSASSNALVFAADNLEATWNGRMMNTGQLCEPGMYFYALEVTDTDGRTWSKGEVVRLFKQ
jgi:gliding motility-associated-like protein